jgi:hypothetical protein
MDELREYIRINYPASLYSWLDTIAEKFVAGESEEALRALVQEYPISTHRYLNHFIDKLYTPLVTRVEVITKDGRECVKYTKGSFRLSYQDGGRTLKLFEVLNEL